MYSEKEVAYYAAEAIRDAGYEVDLFTKTIRALEKIGSRHSIYLLALIGWRMPRLSGIELALKLYKLDPEIRIILFSALDPEMAQDGLDFIARTDNVKFDHLSMPFLYSELLETISTKIGKLEESDIIRRRLRRRRLRKLSPDWYFRLLRYRIPYWRWRIRYHKLKNKQ